MKRAPDEALGVECAWTPSTGTSGADRLWLGVAAAMLAAGAWQVAARWIYVLLAFLS